MPNLKNNSDIVKFIKAGKFGIFGKLSKRSILSRQSLKEHECRLVLSGISGDELDDNILTTHAIKAMQIAFDEGKRSSQSIFNIIPRQTSVKFMGYLNHAKKIIP